MPQQFWQLTMNEFNDLVDGYKWRDRIEWERSAQLAAWIMQPHTKKQVTAKKLLGTNKETPKKTTKEEKEQTLSGLMNDLG